MLNCFRAVETCVSKGFSSSNQFELEPHQDSKLHGPRPAYLIERVQTTQLRPQHVGCLAKRGAGQSGVDGAEVWMVEDVECFGTKLKMKFFRQVELTAQRQIDLPGW